MKLVAPASLFVAAVLALAAVAPYVAEAPVTRRAYHLEAQFTATHAGLGVLWADANTKSVSYAQLLATATPETYRFALPPGAYRELRLEAREKAAGVVLHGARIADRHGATVRALVGEATAPLSWTFPCDPPLVLPVAWGRTVATFAPIAAAWFVLLAGALWAGERSARFRAALAALARRPGRAVALAALAATVVSCHPVIFLGRSFASPNYEVGTLLLYPRHPTLPGYTDHHTENEKASDTSALMWQQLPYSVFQHRALWRDGELPLWNRYNSAGATLLAQGQSMFGDPLHVPVILAGGAAWAWDAKYVVAKWLFACGLGLIVWHATRHRPAALLTALAAPFIGFFIHRVAHTALVSMCYAPWILYAWLRATQAADTRRAIPWYALLVLANWMELNSGSIKEAYMLVLGLNGTGALALACTTLSAAEKLRRFGAAAVAGLLFLLAAAPVWMTFRDALAASYTPYNAPAAVQLPPATLLGLFDELLLRPTTGMLRVRAPSANFLFLLGVLYALATTPWRRGPIDRFQLALMLAAIPPLLLAYGVIPAGWIVRVPVLANVVHIDNTFSCVALVPLIVLAGFGFRAAVQRLGTPAGRRDLGLVAAGGAVLAAAYWIYVKAAGADPATGVRATSIVRDGFLVLLAASVGLAGLARQWLSGQARTAAVPLGVVLCAGVLLGRHGQHAATIFPDYVFNPPVRADLFAHSPGIEWLREQIRTEPARVTGIDGTLSAGWHGVYDLEGLSASDAVMHARHRELMFALGYELKWDWRFSVATATLPDLRRAGDFLNLAYYVGYRLDPDRPPADLPLVHRADIDVLRSDSAWPRAFFTDRLATYDDVNELVARIREGDGRPFAAVEAAQTDRPRDLPSDLDARTIVPATDYRLTTNTTTFRVAAPRAGVVALHETWLDGDTHVTVNGAPADGFRINHAFRGVVVPAAGEYEITFRHRPRHFDARLLLAALGWAGVLTAWWCARRGTARRRDVPRPAVRD